MEYKGNKLHLGAIGPEFMFLFNSLAHLDLFLHQYNGSRNLYLSVLL